jgi:hypothetical protein
LNWRFTGLSWLLFGIDKFWLKTGYFKLGGITYLGTFLTIISPIIIFVVQSKETRYSSPPLQSRNQQVNVSQTAINTVSQVPTNEIQNGNEIKTSSQPKEISEKSSSPVSSTTPKKYSSPPLQSRNQQVNVSKTAINTVSQVPANEIQNDNEIKTRSQPKETSKKSSSPVSSTTPEQYSSLPLQSSNQQVNVSKTPINTVSQVPANEIQDDKEEIEKGDNKIEKNDRP